MTGLDSKMNTPATLEKVEAEISRRLEEIEELQVSLELLKTEPGDYALARKLHSEQCTWNHTDGCGWFYEISNGIHDWSGYQHGVYLGRARRLFSECAKDGITPDTVFKYIKLLKN